MASARELAFALENEEADTAPMIAASVDPLPLTVPAPAAEPFVPAAAGAVPVGFVNNLAQLEGGARAGGLETGSDSFAAWASTDSVASVAGSGASFAIALVSVCDFAALVGLEAALGRAGIKGIAGPPARAIGGAVFVGAAVLVSEPDEAGRVEAAGVAVDDTSLARASWFVDAPGCSTTAALSSVGAVAGVAETAFWALFSFGSFCSTAASCCSKGRDTDALSAFKGLRRLLDLGVLAGKSASGRESHGSCKATLAILTS